MTEFVPFPSTPYLIPPEGIDIRGDKVLTPVERSALLAKNLTVEEKLDGENLGISADGANLLFQARGSRVTPGGRHFHGLSTWVRPRQARLARALGSNLVLFGEWCAVKHSVYYDSLPDWFLVFDVFELSTRQFWRVDRRDELASELGLYVVPRLGSGHFAESDLLELMGASTFGHERMEGIVVRSQSRELGPDRAKLVRTGFTQQIGRHWTAGPRSMNRLA